MPFKGLFTPSESEKNQRKNDKHQRNFRFMSMGLKTGHFLSTFDLFQWWKMFYVLDIKCNSWLIYIAGHVPDPGTDIRPKKGFSSDWGSGSGSESKSEPVQWEQFLYGTMLPSGL